MTKSEAIELLKEGQYLERYPTEKLFHVCADGNVFLQANTSDARAHVTGKGIELVTLSVAAVLADETHDETEAEEVEELTPANLEISAEAIADVTELEPEVTIVKEEVKTSKKAK